MTSPGPWRWSSGGTRLEDAAGTPIIGRDRIRGGIYMPGAADSRALEATAEMLALLGRWMRETEFRPRDDLQGDLLSATQALLARIDGS